MYLFPDGGFLFLEGGLVGEGRDVGVTRKVGITSYVLVLLNAGVEGYAGRIAWMSAVEGQVVRGEREAWETYLDGIEMFTVSPRVP